MFPGMKSSLALLLLTSGLASADEPDWTNRYQFLKAQLLGSNQPPRVGQSIAIMRTVGGGLTGTVERICATQLVIGGRAYTPRELTDKSRKRVFPAAFAIREASQRVLDEQDAFKRVKAERERALADARATPSPTPAAEPVQPAAETQSVARVAMAASALKPIVLEPENAAGTSPAETLPGALWKKWRSDPRALPGTIAAAGIACILSGLGLLRRRLGRRML